jgi:hypothetical protein
MLLGVHRDASALRPAADPRVGAATPGAPLASSIRDGSDDISDKQILESMREKNQRRQIYTQQRLRTCICEGPKTGIPGGICCATKQRYKGFLPRVPPIIPARDPPRAGGSTHQEPAGRKGQADPWGRTESFAAVGSRVGQSPQRVR